ncbi:MAG TPA: glycosyltransferase family 4 protein, partial [Ramlibacter sp.]|nr:glycosyltransferase family 4 protein [Ramlibacter sp.]
ESFGGEVSRREAELSYGLGLRMIANSPWLASVLSDKHGLASVPVCAGAIRQDTFVGEPKPRRRSDELHVISYGGRNAEWKGFREMAEGMKLARARNPRFKFRWSVYGNVLLPPDNSIAPYDALGFLDQRSLAKAYGEHDALLSASWYESFPLFPLEAMASGLATIATRIGAEAYAEDGKTVHVVEPRSPEAIASALERLAVDEPYRFSLATAGKQQALEFTWPKAIARMNDILQRPD